jgi:hypothetical protein
MQERRNYGVEAKPVAEADVHKSGGYSPTAGASPGDERHLRNSPSITISISISAAEWRRSPPLACTAQVSGALYPAVDAQTVSQ